MLMHEWDYQSLVRKFEAFRPELEEIIQGGTLVDYMRQRLLTVKYDPSDTSFPPNTSPITTTNPPLDFLLDEH